MAFSIKKKPTGLRKLLVRTQKRAAHRDTAITTAWWRFVLAQRPIHRRQLVDRTAAPLWNGRDSLQDTTVLLFAPQSFPGIPSHFHSDHARWPAFCGYGDLLVYLRWLPMLIARGAKVIFAGPDKLRRFLAAQPGIIHTLEAMECLPPVLPAVDYGLLALDVPDLLQPDQAHHVWNGFVLPNGIPPLRVPTGTAFRSRSVPPGVRKIGLVWKSDPSHFAAELRTLAVERLAPLFAIPGNAWFSLQFYATEAEWATLRQLHPAITDLHPMTDFADTAAAMADLDLIVTMESAPMYLAGALDLPTIGFSPMRAVTPTAYGPLPGWPSITAVYPPAGGVLGSPEHQRVLVERVAHLLQFWCSYELRPPGTPAAPR